MKRNHSIDTPDLVGEPVFESLGADREVKLLQFPLDRLFQEKFDQHLPRGSRGELNVKGRFVPNEAPPIFEPKMKSQWSPVEQNHVKSQPAAGEDLPNQIPIKRLLGRIEKLTGRVRSRPPCPVLLKKLLQILEDLRLAFALMEAKISRFLEETGMPLQAGLVCRLQISFTLPQDSDGGVRLNFNR